VHAAPALIVLLALHGSFGAVPDIVLSGINRGANVGTAILHSGTVGAALTAGQGGVRALAVSLDVGLREGGGEHWATAAALARRAIGPLLESPPGTVHNLNVPDVPDAERPQLVTAPLAPFGIVQTTMTELDGDEVRLSIREHRASDAPGTDMERLAAGLATITPVVALRG
jgi:5'-nucleotidase